MMAFADSATRLDASYPAQPPQVPGIRRAVGDLATRCGADHATLIRIELAVSEAATNVVLHAYRAPGAGGEIHVTAARATGGFFDVCVGDDGIGMSPRFDSPGMGLGLSLMAHECDELEIRRGDDGGTMVLLRFGLDGVSAVMARGAAA